MAEMKDATEFAVYSDITLRVAMVAFAKAYDEREINAMLDAVAEDLSDVYGKERVADIMATYKGSVLKMRKGLEEEGHGK